MISIWGRGTAARGLRCGASTIVLGAALLQPGTALAQTSPADQSSSSSTNPNAQSPDTTPEKNAIVVTGVRRALQNAAQRKKNADTVVDSITATDIGAFPDKSVAEALQRVPGITVDRIAAHGDVSHFSAEPSGVIIRGLPQVRSEFNGRDIFSANSSRGLSWSDVTPELLAGVDAYKNQTADMIEGGIAGSINLRTRLPFDATGQLIQVGAHANYNSLAKKWTPDGNAFYSNRWQTGIGDFGIMGDVAYSDLKTRNNMIQFGRAMLFEGGALPGSANVSSPDFAKGTVAAPSSLVDRVSDYDRRRTGIAAAGQWRSNDHKWLATAQYLRSYYSNRNEEHALSGNFFGVFGQHADFRFNPSNSPVFKAPGSPDFTFNNDAMLASGTFNQTVGWAGQPVGTPTWASSFGPYTANQFGVNSAGQSFFNPCYSWAAAGAVGGTIYQYPGGPACTAYTQGTNVGSSTRYWKDREMTQDASLNLKWEPTDNLRFNLDGQYIKATVKNYDVTVDFNSFADITLNNLGSLPRMSFGAPTNVNLGPGGLSNPSNWYINDVMDHLEDSKGHEYALRGDGEYDLHSDWLSSLKFGARYSDRKQNLQWSTYNWHNVSNTWTGGCAYLYFNLTSQPGTCNNTTPATTFHGYPSGFYAVQPFGSSFFGGNGGNYPFVPFTFLANGGANGFSADKTGVGSFIPICDRNGQRTPGGDILPVELPNSCFTPDEIGIVDEKTKAGYAELKFGGDNAKFPGSNWTIHGNIGLRFVDTVDNSSGNIVYPKPYSGAACPPVALVPGGLTGTGAPPANLPPGTTFVFPAYCYLTPAQLAFANGGRTPTSARNHFHDWLPSFNLRLDFTPKWLMRFAASRAMSRPDFGLLKNYLSVSQDLPNNIADVRWIKDSTGNVIGVNPTYSATAYNPFLKPVTAWQFDLSLEHYFGNAGQFSLALFHKTFSNYIQSGSFIENITNNGQTVPVVVTGPANGKGAKINGMEVAYNTFFDFLPGWLSGLGLQANYTYVKNKGVPNSNLSSVGANGSTVNGQNGGTALNVSTLEGISTHTVNLIGLYEKGRVSARLAYNWRSKFLVTPIDCCIALPIWQKPTGYLDGSIRFRVTDAIELSVEGQNLLNTRAVLMQQVTDTNSREKKAILFPESWNESDRRFIVGIRWKMGK